MTADELKEEEWVEHYLDAWARAMHREQYGEGLPDHSAGVGGSGYGGYKNVIEDWQSESDERSTAIIDMLMSPESDVLTPVEKLAILHVKGCAVMRFREPLEVLYFRARRKIGIVLRDQDFY